MAALYSVNSINPSDDVPFVDHCPTACRSEISWSEYFDNVNPFLRVYEAELTGTHLDERRKRDTLDDDVSTMQVGGSERHHRIVRSGWSCEMM